MLWALLRRRRSDIVQPTVSAVTFAYHRDDGIFSERELKLYINP